MPSLGPALPVEPDWRPAVSVREDPELARELVGRLRPPGTPKRASVGDLLSPRPAYWRAVVGPVPIPPEREAVRGGGRRLHRILGLVFAPEGRLEVRVHDREVQGRVDVLGDRPIEIKTTAYPPPAADPATERPDHVDQLAVYSTLLGVTSARLVYLQAAGDEVRSVGVFDVEFGSVDGVRRATAERAQALAGAVASGDPTGLPRCVWFARGCEFRGAGVCDCTGEEPTAPPLAADAHPWAKARADLALQLETAVRARLATSRPAVIRRFRDLLYPRRAFFEATSDTVGPPSVSFQSETDTYSRLAEALDCAPVGEVTRLPTLADEPDEEVIGFRGAPVVLRTTRASQRLDPATVVERAPQYALQLGFRCVATGTNHGCLVVGYERSSEEERVQALEYRFEPSATFSRVWRARARRIEAARTAGDPSQLEACPSWMFESCPYRASCGCGPATASSHR
jgi:hypothetical protein